MGLDMYAYRVTKLSGDLKVQVLHAKTYEELMGLDSNLHTLDPSDSEQYELMRELLPFAIKVKVLAQFYDYKKIKKLFNIPQEARCVACTFGSTYRFEFATGETGTRNYTCYQASWEEQENDEMIKTVPTDFYAVYMEEVGYWRKAYPIQEAIHATLKRQRHIQCENCGYYLLDTPTWKEIQADMLDLMECEKEDGEEVYEYHYRFPDSLKEALDVAEDEEEPSIFYHEWY